MRPELGRGFGADDEAYGGAPIVALSDALWRRRFGADSSVLGREITLDGSSYQVVGVLPRDIRFVGRSGDFEGRAAFDAWIPLRYDPHELPALRGTHPLRVFGRLRPGPSVELARAELDRIARTLERIHPKTNEDRGVALVPVSTQALDGVSRPLFVLLGAAGLVLAIACVNVAGLLLGRAAGRAREMAVRVALGGGRGRLARQLVTEGLLLATIGGAAGLVAAGVTIGMIRRVLPYDLPRVADVGIDWRVLAGAALVVTVAGVLFGIVPLLHTRASEIHVALRSGLRTVGSGTGRLRRAFAVGQIALALALLVGAGLTLRSLWRLLRIDPGFQTQHILTARLSLPASRDGTPAAADAFYRALLERLRQFPGVTHAAVVANLPLSGTDGFWGYQLEGWSDGASRSAKYRPVSADYFETLSVPLRAGRLFTDTDAPDAPPVVAINETMARELAGTHPLSSIIGWRLRLLDPTMRWRTIVGVVGDVRHVGFDRPAVAELYLPLGQTPFAIRDAFLAVGAQGDPIALTPSVRRASEEIQADVPIFDVQTMAERVTSSTGESRFRAVLLGVFGLLALIMATIGVFGVTSYLVGQRTREFGIRLVLGARPQDLVRQVMRGTFRVVLGGLAVGLLGAWALGRLLASVLFGVSAFDGPTVLAVSALLTVAALLAGYLPARRVTRLDPGAVLRTE